MDDNDVKDFKRVAKCVIGLTLAVISLIKKGDAEPEKSAAAAKTIVETGFAA